MLFYAKNLVLLGLLMLAGVFCAGDAYAQELLLGEEEIEIGKVEDNNKVRAEEFFNDCVANPLIRTSQDTDMAFCACTASNMYAWLEKPQEQQSNREFFETLEVKELDKDTLLSKIYGSCLHIPIYDLTFEDCYYDKRKTYFTEDNKKRKDLCACIAKGEASYFQFFTVPFIELKIEEGEDIIDPIAEMKTDTNYYDSHYNLESNCYVEQANKQ